MDYMRYSRDVIVLEEKDREFADKPGEEMKGYLRVETGNNRGAFRCVIQNVKYYPRSEYTYQLILFGKRGERTIHTVVGAIPVNHYAVGEVYLRFHPNDVDGQGNDYGRYTTAIVAAVSSKDRREQLHPVLVGTTGNRPAAVTIARIPAPAEEAPEERKTFNHYYAQYLKHVCQYLWEVSGRDRGFRLSGARTPEENASLCDLRKIRWMKIEDPSAMFLVSPGAKYFSEKYGHFLLGYSGGTEESAIYYAAVPGRSCPEDQPDGGESGFQLWIPLVSQGEAERGANVSEKGSCGYWILGIDGNSGEIFSCKAQ